MPAPQNAPLPPFFSLNKGMTIRLTALDATSGAVVAGVVVSGASLDVDPVADPNADDGITPTPLLVPAEASAA